jgi:hypothetical protein
VRDEKVWGAGSERLYFRRGKRKKSALKVSSKCPIVFIVCWRDSKALESEKGKALGSGEGKETGSELCYMQRKHDEQCLFRRYKDQSVNGV